MLTSGSKAPSSAAMELHFSKVEFAQGSEVISGSFVDTTLTVQDRIVWSHKFQIPRCRKGTTPCFSSNSSEFFVPDCLSFSWAGECRGSSLARIMSHKEIAATILEIDLRYKNRGPTDSYVKFQRIINRCKTTEGIDWFYKFASDSLRMKYVEVNAFTCSKLDTYHCDLAMMKLECRTHLMTQWIKGKGLTAEEIMFCTKVLADHKSVRVALTNYPGELVNNNSDLYLAPDGPRRRSVRLIVQFWERMIYGPDYDSALSQAAKYCKTVVEMLEGYTTFGDDLKAITDAFKVEEQQAIANAGTHSEKRRADTGGGDQDHVDIVKVKEPHDGLNK